MFDIGWTELLVIAVVAIIVVGPKDLPGMLRTLGRYAGKLKSTAGEFRAQFDDALRDSELDELRSTMRDVGDLNPVNKIRDTVTESLSPLKETAGEITSGIDSVAGTGRMNTDPKPEPEKSAEKPAKKAAAKTPKPRKPAAGKKKAASTASKARAAKSGA